LLVSLDPYQVWVLPALQFVWPCGMQHANRRYGVFDPAWLRFDTETPPRPGSISTHVSMFRNCQPIPITVRTIVINLGAKPRATRSNNATHGKTRSPRAIATVAPPNADAAMMNESMIRGKINAPINPPPISIAVPKKPPIT